LYDENSQGVELALGSSLLHFGLRAVDGSNNNIVEGRGQWGASGEQFVFLADRHWVEGSGSMPATPPGMPSYPTNNDYESGGSVVDGQPRLISNLIVDQTLKNPAAIISALEHAGYAGDAFAAVAD